MQFKTSTALADLHKQIGLKDTIELLEVALPLIEKRSEELQQYLQAQDWDAAARIAHRMLSSANLYSSQDFIDRLQLINQKNIDVISSIKFQQELLEESESIYRTVVAWLNAKH